MCRDSWYRSGAVVQQMLRLRRVIPIEPAGLVSTTKHRQIERHAENLIVIRDVLATAGLPRWATGDVQGFALRRGGYERFVECRHHVLTVYHLQALRSGK